MHDRTDDPFPEQGPDGDKTPTNWQRMTPCPPPDIDVLLERYRDAGVPVEAVHGEYPGYDACLMLDEDEWPEVVRFAERLPDEERCVALAHLFDELVDAWRLRLGYGWYVAEDGCKVLPIWNRNYLRRASLRMDCGMRCGGQRRDGEPCKRRGQWLKDGPTAWCWQHRPASLRAQERSQ